MKRGVLCDVVVRVCFLCLLGFLFFLLLLPSTPELGAALPVVVPVELPVEPDVEVPLEEPELPDVLDSFALSVTSAFAETSLLSSIVGLPPTAVPITLATFL